jgi:hypothetical protein
MEVEGIPFEAVGFSVTSGAGNETSGCMKDVEDIG